MAEEKLFEFIAEELNLNLLQVRNTVEMLDQDNTVPFIARYRKEKTGSLDEDQIRMIRERITYLRTLVARKQTIINAIREQGKLTPELEKQIETTFKLRDLEDLYLPFRPKKKTRASIAREKGLEPLAQIILVQEIEEGQPQKVAEAYINKENDIYSSEEAIQGALDILAEVFAEDARVRKQIRKLMWRDGVLVSEQKKAEASREYQMYFEYSETVRRIRPHRVLAINRGEKEKSLKVSIEIEKQTALDVFNNLFIKNRKSVFHDFLQNCINDSWQRLVNPAIQREIRSQLTEKAEEHAIGVFAVNLRNLLMQPPVSGKRIMGIDPGFRTGCKVAVIDETGNYLAGETIYPHPPQKKYFEAKTTLRGMIEKYDIPLVAIGNGTASRESELMIAELIKEMSPERSLVYVIVDEAGASVYSASEIAREEFPELEASMRGNISIARRLQDPLAELVKIDPKSIGVGLYQHDVDQNLLSETLTTVVESCVNRVGVDLNTASASLLTFVSGLNRKTARKIVDERNKTGRFANRDELKNIAGIGRIAYQQSAGFLRITDGDNPLDATGIHPESYAIANRLLKKFAITDVRQGGQSIKEQLTKTNTTKAGLAAELDCGEPTLADILDDLEKPGRDPRLDMPRPLFRQDVLKIEDLKEGMTLQGTVRNVVDFGLFVDIGVKSDGLVHVSKMSDSYVKSPHEVARVGDIIQVKVVSVDLDRQRIALSMKDVQ